jgi:3',5'-cyclic AMP phosphodiesterase CpdA
MRKTAWAPILAWLWLGCGGAGEAADAGPDGAEAEDDAAVPDAAPDLPADDTGVDVADAPPEADPDAADADADDEGEAEADVPGCTLTGERCFSFAQVTDLHVGELADDYGTTGWDDSGGEEDDRTAALRRAVAKINMGADDYDIRFVMATGDFGDSGERSEVHKAREILDALDVPYFPLIGNHDMWPYVGNDEAPSPMGDAIFDEEFAEEFALVASLFDGFTKAPVPSHNPDCDCESRFLNYGFDYEGYHFIALDLVTRGHAPLWNEGVTSEADLHDFEGGTWPWFQAHLRATAMPGAANTFIFSHHPPVVTTLGILDCLTTDEVGRIDDLLREDGVRGAVWGFFAGHHHLDYTLERFDGQQVVVMPGTKDEVVRVIQLFGDGRVDVDTLL